MIEKDVKEKEHSEEIDPKLKELIEIMKLIQKEMPNAEKEERITVFLEFCREKENHFRTEKQNTNNANPVNIESLLNTLSFKLAKNGKSEFATIDPEIAQKLPREFQIKDNTFFVKKDSKTPVIIKLKKKTPQ
ncbi:MAG: hypothetical protein GU362_06280 [Thaumarchaeota archaeon]|jgi:hypothetical protein|nr:hypothetical protein [Nitrososphaerota archaeon]